MTGNQSGTTTFLFTDLVGSTELLDRLGEYAWARMLRERDEPGDRDHAMQLVTSARATTNELEMQSLGARLARLEQACAPMAERR